MARNEWMQRPARSSRGLRRGRRPAENRFAPRVDALEGRALLSLLTVTSAADAGDGSLRATIERADPGDTIRFDPGLTGQTIRLTGGALEIDKSLTIEGPGTNELAISGGDRSGVFVIDESTAIVSLSGLTITGGNADRGGGIASSAARLTVADSALSGNRAHDGGAIAQTGGALIVSASTFSGNRAEGDVARGGAIYNGSGADVTMVDSRFLGNEARAVTTGSGGAVYNEFDVTLDVLGGRFAENRAEGDLANGGAIVADYPIGFPPPPAGRLTVAGTDFVRNQAASISVDRQGWSGQGGAIFSQVALSVTGGRFLANQALGGAGDGPEGRGGASAGGAIYFSGSLSNSPLAIDSSRFVGNESIGGDGAIEGGGAEGGAITFISGSAARVAESQFVGNRARGGSASTPGVTAGWAIGGALDIGSSTTITNSLLIGNQSLGGEGTGGASGGMGQGGGITNSALLTLDRTQLIGNLARGGRGAIGGDGLGGGISTSSDRGASLTAIDSLVGLNAALGGRGESEGSDGQGLGGGLVVFSGTPSLIRTRFVANVASTDGADIYDLPDA